MNTPQSAPVEAQEAPEAVTEDTNINDVPTPIEIAEAMEEALDNLNIEMKQFAATHFTPEIAMFIEAWLGPEAGDVVMKYADPDIVLLPVPRKEAEEMLGQLPEEVQNTVLGNQSPNEVLPKDTEEELS